MVVVAVTSGDGGVTWRETRIEAWGWDPWLTFLSGTALLACLDPGAGPDPILVHRSEDGGATWQGPMVLEVEGTSFDHPIIVADTAPGPGRGSVSILSGHTIPWPGGGRARLTAPAVHTSRDGGLTFSSPSRLQATNVWQMPTSAGVTREGKLGFTILDYAADYRGAGGFRVLRTKRVWWATSDNGRSFSMPYLVDEKEQLGWSAAAVDVSSGPFGGRIYVAIRDVREGTGGVFVIHSTDGGATWSKAVSVGSPFAPDSGFDFRLPALAVNHRGEVVVTWFAAAEAPGKACGRLAASASTDCGVTFLPPVPVADAGSCNDRPGNVVQPTGGPFNVAGRFQSGGDYYGLTALSDGSFRVLWSDSRTGVPALDRPDRGSEVN